MYEDRMAEIIRVDISGREHGRLDLLYLFQEFQGKGIGSVALVQIESMYPDVLLCQ
ncbi:MAG: hypothetical protein PUC65_12800 [Clostridiales bacterium]|nr:hypothetical protein [Clostridiales bacterium]